MTTYPCKRCGCIVEYIHSTKMCKSCISDYNKEIRHTPDGLLGIIYNDQKASSRRRNHQPPQYTLAEFREWVHNCVPVFESLFNDWVIRGFNREFTPSFDRIDPRQSYTLNNLRCVAWNENRKKRYSDQVIVVKSDNTSGITGVSFISATNKYAATIIVAGKNEWLGQYESKRDAAEARWSRDIELGRLSLGEYTRLVALHFG